MKVLNKIRMSILTKLHKIKNGVQKRDSVSLYSVILIC